MSDGGPAGQVVVRQRGGAGFPLGLGILLGAQMPIAVLVVCPGNHDNLLRWGRAVEGCRASATDATRAGSPLIYPENELLGCSDDERTIMAVRLRKLAPDEAQRAFPRRGQQDLSDYLAALGELQPGEAAAIERAGLSDRAIKRRLGAAAKQLGYQLKWARQPSPEALYFQVIGTPAAKPANGRRQRRTASAIPAPP